MSQITISSQSPSAQGLMQSSTTRANSTHGSLSPSSSRTATVSSDVPTSSAAGSVSASTFLVTSFSGDALPSATFISTPLHVERRSNTVGPAVGGAIGGLVAVLVLVAFLLWRKRSGRMDNSNAGVTYIDDEKSPRLAKEMFPTPLDPNLPILSMHKVSTPSSDTDMFPPDSSLANMFTSSPSSVSHDHSADGLDDSYTRDPHDENASQDVHDVELGLARSAPGTTWVATGAYVQPQVHEAQAEITGVSEYVVQETNAGPRRPHYLSLLSISSLIPSVRHSPSTSTPQSTESQRSRRSGRALPVPPLPPLHSPSTPSSSSLTSPSGSVRRPLPSPNSPSTPSLRQLPSIKQLDSPGRQ